MEAKAYLKYARISPRKVQIVCDLIRGKRCQHRPRHPAADPEGGERIYDQAAQQRRRQRRKQP